MAQGEVSSCLMFESLLKSALEALFKTAFRIFGIVLGLIPILIVVGLIVSREDDRPAKLYNEFIEPTHTGRRALLSHTKKTILQISIEGTIGLQGLTKQRIEEMLVEASEGDLEKEGISGILLLINTPGGTVVDSDGIYRAIRSYKEEHGIPVFAFVDGLCASGGMYIASAADQVFASDVSIVGSIGVILSPFFNVSEPMEKLGIKSKTLYKGSGKDAMSMTRPWGENEDENIKMVVDHTYDLFVNLVSESRGIPQETVVNKLGAHVFPAAVAKELHLIDETAATRNNTLFALVQMAGIDPDNYQVVSLQKENLFKNLLSANSPLFTGKIEHEMQLNGLPNQLQGKLLYLYQPGL